MEKIKVLIADDEWAICDLIEKELKKYEDKKASSQSAQHIFNFLSNKAVKRLTLQALRVYNTGVNG